MIAAIDLRGRYREPFANWEAFTNAPAARLRGDIALLPAIAEAGLACAGKDISQGGIIGTATMLAECSGVGAVIDVLRRPDVFCNGDTDCSAAIRDSFGNAERSSR